MPRKFSIITNELDVKSDDNYSQELWIVYSDRNNNKIYLEPNINSKVVAKANFLDAFYVANQNDDFILAVKGKLKKGKFDKDVVYLGWIPKRNLILSKHTLKNKNYIYKKALVINSINHIEEVLEKKNINSLSYREGPGLNYPERDTSRVFKIYFVLKTDKTENSEPTMYLLARRSLLYSTSNLDKAKLINQKIVLGWIPATSVTPWNHRVAVEQNWDVDAVVQRKKYKTPALIFLDKEKLKKGGNLKLKDKIVLLRKDRFYETNLEFYKNNRKKLQSVLESKRLDGYNMRYPIIKDYGKYNMQVVITAIAGTLTNTLLFILFAYNFFKFDFATAFKIDVTTVKNLWITAGVTNGLPEILVSIVFVNYISIALLALRKNKS